MLSVTDEFKNDKFELPGIEFRGYASYSLATSLIHSGRYNMRGLEYYSYGFYAILLQDLVSHLAPRALVIPQFGSGALAIELDGDFSDSDSIATFPKKGISELFPDFAVVLMRAVFVDGGQPVTASVIRHEFEPWGDIKIERLSISILAEAKRRPTRTALGKGAFIKSLRSRIDRAVSELEKQAQATFIAYPGTNLLILIAFAGEWFCWRLVTRKDYGIDHLPKGKTADNSTGTPPTQAETSHSELVVQALPADVPPSDVSDTPQSNRLPHRTTRNPNPVYRSSPSPENLESFKVPYNPNPNQRRGRTKGLAQPQKASSKPYKAVLKRYVPADLGDIVELQKPLTEEDWSSLNKVGGSFASIKSLQDNNWSGYILFGTQEAKESWFLIRKALEEQMARLDNYNTDMQPGNQSSEDSGNEGIGGDDELAEHEEIDPDECSSLHSEAEEDGEEDGEDDTANPADSDYF